MSTDAHASGSPWYRHFWVWFIVLLLSAVVIGSVFFVFIAARHADDLVVDDYYKSGLAINRKLEKEQRAAALKLTATPHFTGNQVVVELSQSWPEPRLRLSLSHPVDADQDVEIELVLEADGRYHGDFAAPPPFHWHWQLESIGPDAWRLGGTVQPGA